MVVVIQEIFGVNADVQETCVELARLGYIAVAPDLFWRQAPGLNLNSWSEVEWKRGLDLYAKYDFDQGVRDIDALITAARGLEGSTGKVGIMGFCLGGLMTYLTAARTNVDAAAAYYGGGIDQHVGEAGDIDVPTIIHLAEQDEFIPEDARKKIVEAMASRSDVTVYTYPGCNHAFARHTGSHYDAEAAHKANERTYAHFATTLKS